jgi:hypothetical protein
MHRVQLVTTRVDLFRNSHIGVKNDDLPGGEGGFGPQSRRWTALGHPTSVVVAGDAVGSP